MTIAAQTPASDDIMPPRAANTAVQATTTVAATFDTSTIPVAAGTADAGRYLVLQAEGGDVYYITGAVATDVNGTKAPSATATGGAGANGVALRIPKDTEKSHYFKTGADVWIGFVGSAAGYLRISQSSR